ncbi:MAG TPA: archaemetzincin [Candidatus Sulfotelmatobacter sp.]|nr:archaemetzincin [Candidatus Sulfotelmatobacter sp.]
MNLVHLLPVGTLGKGLLEGLCEALPRCLPVRCEIVPHILDPAAAYHAERQQFHSSEILQRMHRLVSGRTWRLLAVADVDLYIPILKYVFGEAQMGGPCALVSACRLRQEFYGLDGDEELVRTRLLKECIHELGHTLDLRHCQDYRCAMASAHAVEWIDLRETGLCESCRSRLETSAGFEVD